MNPPISDASAGANDHQRERERERRKKSLGRDPPGSLLPVFRGILTDRGGMMLANLLHAFKVTLFRHLEQRIGLETHLPLCLVEM